MVTLKELSADEYFGPGHRLCAGCGSAATIRMAMKAAGESPVVVNATGCVEVASTIYPYTAWGKPWVHGLFENAPAIASGIEGSFKSFKRRNRPAPAGKILVFAGDGGTFDIGLQALSGAMERRQNFTYICNDNEAYMNTGIQRSSATPKSASTTTSPVGRAIPGKREWKKDLVGITVAHRIDYVATASPAYWMDYLAKVKKAMNTEGPALIHVIAPCPLGWRFPTDQTIKLARMAVLTRYFPLYEVDHGTYRLTTKVARPLPLEDFLRPQGRFQHLFRPENESLLHEIAQHVEENWNRIVKLCEPTAA